MPTPAFLLVSLFFSLVQRFVFCAPSQSRAPLALLFGCVVTHTPTCASQDTLRYYPSMLLLSFMWDDPSFSLSSLQGENRQMSHVQASKRFEVQGWKGGRSVRSLHCVPVICCPSPSLPPFTPAHLLPVCRIGGGVATGVLRQECRHGVPQLSLSSLFLCRYPYHPYSLIHVYLILSRDTSRLTGAASSASIRAHRGPFGACRAFHQPTHARRLTAMSQLSIVKDQLLSKGINHFVVLSSSGQVVEYSGDFENKEKQVLAYAILHQCSALFAKGESMKRVTMKFEDVLYVATTVEDSATVYGVVAKRPTNGATM